MIFHVPCRSSSLPPSPSASQGLKNVSPMMCGSCANENAYKAAFIAHMEAKRGGRPPTQEELESTMVNQAPGSPPLRIVSFDGAFHGRLLGCLSTTHSKAIHKLDIPAFDWCGRAAYRSSAMPNTGCVNDKSWWSLSLKRLSMYMYMPSAGLLPPFRSSSTRSRIMCRRTPQRRRARGGGHSCLRANIAPV